MMHGTLARLDYYTKLCENLDWVDVYDNNVNMIVNMGEIVVVLQTGRNFYGDNVSEVITTAGVRGWLCTYVLFVI